MNEQINHIKSWLGAGSINIFGAPFAGKDTQGAKLAELLGAELLGGGDILRSSIIPEHVSEIMHQGKLIPTPDYIEIVLPKLSEPALAGKPLILSSVGRWHGEEEGVLAVAKQSGHPLKAVIFLELPEEEINRRWHASQALADRGDRADDSRDKIEMRIAEFNNKTRPVIEFYQDRGLCTTIDGQQSREAVAKNIIDSLTTLALQS